MTGGPVSVDLWGLGRRIYEVHWPLVQAFRHDPAVRQRMVISTANADRRQYEELPVPRLELAVPVGPGRAAFPLRVIADRRRLRAFVRQQPGLIHVTLASPWDLFYLPTAKRAGARILITVHDAAPHPGDENPLLVGALKRVWALADHIAVLSSHVAETMLPSWLGGRPVHVVPNGLLTTAGPLLEPRRFPQGRPLRLLFFGRIVHYKGLDLLLDAVALLRREGFALELTVAGSGDYEPYRAQLAALDCVTIIDDWIPVADKNRLFAGHDVNMLPYREASQSGNALDGLFAAMPSIATPTGGLTEQLGDNDTIFANPEQAAALAGAIRRLGSDPVLFERLSAGAHASAMARGPGQAAREWAALYREIAP